LGEEALRCTGELVTLFWVRADISKEAKVVGIMEGLGEPLLAL